jgi:hypothetical protein
MTPSFSLTAALDAAFPGYAPALAASPFAQPDALWPMVVRLARVPAPTTGAGLPGAVGLAIAALAREHGLPAPAPLAASGNLHLPVGSDRGTGAEPGARPHVWLCAHMDRPTFKVRDAATGALYPICAIRFPADAAGEYRARAHALRWAEGALTAAAHGTLVYRRGEGEAGETCTFEADTGQLGPFDLITLDQPPARAGDVITGTGFDNLIGVLVALGAAHIVAQVLADARTLHAASFAFVFTEGEEGNPAAFFGQGAARLSAHLPPPLLGALVVDTHGENADSPRLGAGVSYGHVSAWGRGSVAPPNAIALAGDLAAALAPGTVQMNTGYQSRSDDLALTRQTTVLGMFGPPIRAAHTAEEQVSLRDVAAGVAALSAFLLLLCVPDAAARYALVG